MDSDDLSNETYKAIFITAENFNHDLTLQFGLLSYECENDEEYLKKANELIDYWKSNLTDSIDDIFFDAKPTTASFEKVLSGIQTKIQKVLKIPVEKRTFDF